MPPTPPQGIKLAASFTALVLATACSNETRVSEAALLAPNGPAIVQGFGEGELLGNILLNGQLTNDSGWYVVLEPNNEATQDRLIYWSGSMWASPRFHNGRAWMFEWIDPRADGACGNIGDYLAGNLSARGDEMHWSSPTTGPSGKERHCIRPGRYRLRVGRHSNGSNPYKDIVIDYVPLRGAPTSPLSIANSAGGIDHVEELNYDTTAYAWSDVVILVDSGSTGGGDSPVLQIQNGDGDPYSTQFADDGAPTGDKFDYFRFDSRLSTTTTTGLGRLASKLYWDISFPNLASGYYDSHPLDAYGIIRVHQFTDVTSSGTYQVGLETMRPSEQPLTAPNYSRPVSITVPVPPPPALATIVSGPDLLEPATPTTETWTQEASGGVPIYHYGPWSYYKSPGPEAPVGSGVSYDRTVSPTASPYVFRLRAAASDDAPQGATAKYFVEVVPAGGGGAIAAVDQSRRGVRLMDGSCGSRPPSGPARQRWLQWVFEQRQGRVEPCLS